MPEVNEVRTLREHDYCKEIYIVCPDCGKERWVQIRKEKPVSIRCRNCGNKAKRGKHNQYWKGSRINHGGYVEIEIPLDSFFYPMVGKGAMRAGTRRILEHRLVMAQHLGRCLQSWEGVHHKNGIKNDNRLENLELTTRNTHSSDHSKGYQDGYQKGFTDGRSSKIRQLQARVKELEQREVGN